MNTKEILFVYFDGKVPCNLSYVLCFSKRNNFQTTERSLSCAVGVNKNTSQASTGKKLDATMPNSGTY